MSEHCANPARASASVRAINLWNSTIWGGPVAAEPKMQSASWYRWLAMSSSEKHFFVVKARRIGVAHSNTTQKLSRNQLTKNPCYTMLSD